jgi:hypothetical protein
MGVARQLLSSAMGIVAMLALATAPVDAQGKSKAKHYTVTSDKAVSVSRTVLTEQGYHIVRVERTGPTRVIYFRRGNKGRGKGKGPIQRMVIRTTRERVYFEEVDPAVLIDIDIRLKL